MDREQMRMAILNQEQTFRQQVHELHRVYHVQKQLMKDMQMAGLNRSQAISDDVDTKPKLNISHNEKATNHEQFYNFSNSKAPASADECNLELTLATGSSSSRGSRSQKGKQVKSSNSDSGTAVSSTSTESELAQFKEFDVLTTVRFQSEGKRLADERNQSPWLHQCLSLRMA